jgi:hypothetical protein
VNYFARKLNVGGLLLVGLLSSAHAVYVDGNPLTFVDPSGLATAVVVNKSTSGNPFGHAALAVTGGGVYSFGNTTPLGSSLTDYLAREAARRDTEIRIIETTTEQERQILDYLRRQKDDVGYFDNCSVRSTNALRAGGVQIPYGNPLFPEILRRTMDSLPGTTVTIPRYGDVPSILHQFNP